MIDKILELANTFSEEAQKAALDKCVELGLDTNRGIVSLEESFINLNALRLLLIDVINKNKLIQLPITVQTVISTHLENISASLTRLTGGADEVVNIVNHVEALNAAIWLYGLNNLSDEFLGYQTKLNQVKKLELEVNKLKAELIEGLSIKETLQAILHDAEGKGTTLQNILSTSEEKVKSIDEKLVVSTESDLQVAAKLSTVTQNETSSSELLATIKAKYEEIITLSTSIKDFHGEIDAYQVRISEIQTKAETSVTNNIEETSKLVKELQELEEEIRVQIQNATGRSLFHSFQIRKDRLAKVKWYWASAIGMLLVATLAWSLWLSQHGAFDTAFYLKLSMSLPLIYAITFCTSQYSHERKLEEEYAFKSNISVSLVPYKELIESIVDDEKPEELHKYTSFMVDSINKVFTSPTEVVYSHKDKKELGSKELKELISQLSPLLKILKP